MNAHILFNFIQTYIQISLKFHGIRVVCGGGGGCQLIYIVSPYRYVNIQSVFWRRRSRAEFCLVYFFKLFCFSPSYWKLNLFFFFL